MKSSKMLLSVRDLWAKVDGKSVLNGISLEIESGEIHALMGRNGSGKSSFSFALMGHPKFEIERGAIFLKGEEITALSAEERAKRRVFLAFQHPVAIPGVTVANFLRTCIRAVRGDEVPPAEVRKLIKKEAAALEVPESFMTRYMNEGFSGGEKKRLEMLQLRLLKPRLAVLDEMDSGLDIDALKLVCDNIEDLKRQGCGILLITHYQKMLETLRPDRVHVLMDGKIVKSGSAELAREVESRGYDWLDGNQNAPDA